MMIIMSKINLLMTGLASACTEDFKINNLNLSWLFDNPSTLLWADKILITKYMDDSISSLESSGLFKDKTALSKSLYNVFNLLKDHKIIKVKNSKKIYNENINEKIKEEMSIELETFSKLFPENFRIDKEEDSPLNIIIDNEKYCPTNLISIYASLILSKKWNAQCLFSNNETNFLKYKMNGSSIINNNTESFVKSFDSIFNTYLPDLPLIPGYSIFSGKNSKCNSCRYLEKCENTYLDQLEENLIKYLNIREIDELVQMKNVLYDINKKINSRKYLIDSESLIEEFSKTKNIINKKMRTIFPKVSKWSNYTMMASTAIGFVGTQTNLPTISEIGFSIAGISSITQGYLKHLENKYKWVGFNFEDVIYKK